MFRKFLTRYRCHTWDSPLETDSVEQKHRLYPSSTIQLPSSFDDDNSTNRKDARSQRNDSNEEKVDEARRQLTKAAEPIGHGSFEDQELVNVVQDLVTSRCCFVNAVSKRLKLVARKSALIRENFTTRTTVLGTTSTRCEYVLAELAFFPRGKPIP